MSTSDTESDYETGNVADVSDTPGEWVLKPPNVCAHKPRRVTIHDKIYGREHQTIRAIGQFTDAQKIDIIKDAAHSLANISQVLICAREAKPMHYALIDYFAHVFVSVNGATFPTEAEPDGATMDCRIVTDTPTCVYEEMRDKQIPRTWSLLVYDNFSPDSVREEMSALDNRFHMLDFTALIRDTIDLDATSLIIMSSRIDDDMICAIYHRFIERKYDVKVLDKLRELCREPGLYQFFGIQMRDGSIHYRAESASDGEWHKYMI